MKAMPTSRRTLLAGLAGLATASSAASARPAPATETATIAEEHFARLIAAAHAPDAACASQAGRYADAHWHAYLGAARAVLSARA
jgi:hypothetical protein